MEFPDLGKQCGMTSCSQLDFLPIECKYCSLSFCKHHCLPDVHECKKFDNSIKDKVSCPKFLLFIQVM